LHAAVCHLLTVHAVRAWPDYSTPMWSTEGIQGV
jgi:hypothetical protein